jgi:hypothetical protein
MARVFTITFEFNGQNFQAIVATRTVDGRNEFSIQLDDSELNMVIPERRFEYSKEEGCKQPHLLNNNLSFSLISCIADSIDAHLQNTPQHA